MTLRTETSRNCIIKIIINAIIYLDINCLHNRPFVYVNLMVRPRNILIICLFVTFQTQISSFKPQGPHSKGQHTRQIC